MKKIYLILVLISILQNEIICQKPSSGSFDDLLNNVFGGNISEKSGAVMDGNMYKGPTYAPCGDSKICVPFYNCKAEDGSLNIDGAGILDIRIDETKPCISYLETCCETDAKSIDNNNIPTPKPIVEHKNSCGNRNADGLLFKITGNKDGETEYGEFPWMIAVLKHEKAGTEVLNYYQCGGSLIHPQVVLSAAHCIYKNDAQDLTVRAGEWDTQTKDEIYKEQDRQVIEIVLHEKFSKGGLHNDVALLFTAEPFNLGEDISTVCLPPPNMNFDLSRCFATGWGKDQFGQQGKYQVIMKKIDLPVVPYDVCQNKLRETRLGKFFELHESFICAGGEIGKDTCKGDGGGPLSCPIPGKKGRYYQAGIVAWGIECGGVNPGVYASVSYLRDWIDNALSSRNFDASYYTAL